MSHILIVEDETTLAETIAYNLREEGYRTTMAADGVAALQAFRQEQPDLVLLDVMLPGIDGLDVCRQIRKESADTPVLILTAKAREIDKVIGLEVGADDYITKPFGMLELIARVRVALRRVQRERQRMRQRESSEGEVFRGLGLELDAGKHTVTLNGMDVKLRRKEFDLLYCLIAQRGRVIERAALLDRVWGEDEYLDQGTLDVHIRRLRQKIEDDPGQPKRILTVHGVGYKFAE